MFSRHRPEVKQGGFTSGRRKDTGNPMPLPDGSSGLSALTWQSRNDLGRRRAMGDYRRPTGAGGKTAAILFKFYVSHNFLFHVEIPTSTKSWDNIPGFYL